MIQFSFIVVGINKIIVTRQDLDFEQNSTFCDGKIIGAIFNGTILLKESGNITNRKTIYHEVGHNVFKKISEEEKKEWEKLHGNSKIFVSVYASSNYVEDFAESFSCYMTNFDDCSLKLDPLKLQFIERATPKHL